MPSHLWLAKGGIVTNSGLRRRPGPRNHASRGNKEPSRVLAWLKGLQGGGSRSDGGNRKIPAPTQGFGIKYSTPLAAGRSGGAAHPCPVNDLADSGAVTGPAEPSGNPIRCPTVEHLAQEKRTSMAWFIQRGRHFCRRQFTHGDSHDQKRPHLCPLDQERGRGQHVAELHVHHAQCQYHLGRRFSLAPISRAGR